MHQAPCPVSDIDRALSCYIHSREETSRIRRTLSKYFTASLRPINTSTQNRHLNHECPQASFSAASANPPGLKAPWLDYLNALRRRHAAQMRLSELRKSLNELQNRHIVESPAANESQYDNEITKRYVALVHERMRLAQFQVIQASLEKLLDINPANATSDLKTLVKDTMGEQPDPPTERLDMLSQPSWDDAIMLRLKKEVLESRASMELANRARAEAHATFSTGPKLDRQVYALGRAHEELQNWVEGELAKLEEESFMDDASPVKRPPSDIAPLDLASSETQIRGSYDQYTASRSAAIACCGSLQSTPNIQSDAFDNTGGRVNSEVTETEPPILERPTRVALPCLPGLSCIENNERSLLQQAVYLQSQIALIDGEIADALLRLSGESHLVPSGSKAIESWGKIARQVGTQAEQFVEARLQEIFQEVRSVTTVVDHCSLQSKLLSPS